MPGTILISWQWWAGLQAAMPALPLKTDSTWKQERRAHSKHEGRHQACPCCYLQVGLTILLPQNTSPVGEISFKVLDGYSKKKIDTMEQMMNLRSLGGRWLAQSHITPKWQNRVSSLLDKISHCNLLFHYKIGQSQHPQIFDIVITNFEQS